MFVPNIVGALANFEFAGYFMELGVPLLATGITMGLNEKNGNSKMVFPGTNLIDDFERYSRFPQGLPSGLKRSELRLIVTAEN